MLPGLRLVSVYNKVSVIVSNARGSMIKYENVCRIATLNYWQPSLINQRSYTTALTRRTSGML